MKRLIALCILVACPSVVFASDYRFEDLPVGNRAMVLGGAFTALSNDPSGLYYNPAGLVDASRTNVSISASLYGLGQKLIEASEDASSQFRIIPGALGGLYTFFNDQGRGRSPAACAFSLLSPSAGESESLTVQVSTEEQGYLVSQETTTTQRQNSDTILWGGVGCGYAFNEAWSVGMSMFVVHRAAEYSRQDTWIRSTIDRFAEYFEGAEDSKVYYQSVSNMDLSDQAVIFKLGTKFRWDSLYLGLRLRLPSFSIASQGQARNSIFSSAIGDFPAQVIESEADSEDREGSLTSTTVYPAGVRMGAAWVAHKSFTVSCDANVDFATSYERLSFADEELQERFKLPTTVDRKLNTNVSCGFEVLVDDSMSLAVGGFTNHHAMKGSFNAMDAEEFKLDGERDTSDIYGFSASLGSFGEHSLSRIGVTLTAANGRILSYNTWKNSWSVFDTYEWSAYLFLASTFRY